MSGGWEWDFLSQKLEDHPSYGLKKTFWDDPPSNKNTRIRVTVAPGKTTTLKLDIRLKIHLANENTEGVARTKTPRSHRPLFLPRFSGGKVFFSHEKTVLRIMSYTLLANTYLTCLSESTPPLATGPAL